MNQILGKLCGYWFSKRASKELFSVGDDINLFLVNSRLLCFPWLLPDGFLLLFPVGLLCLLGFCAVLAFYRRLPVGFLLCYPWLPVGLSRALFPLAVSAKLLPVGLSRALFPLAVSAKLLPVGLSRALFHVSVRWVPVPVYFGGLSLCGGCWLSISLSADWLSSRWIWPFVSHFLSYK
ncbi:hypothetical protein M5K25_002551 [Dendrobium thyrsiflorum]|uniref:Uncharacterized protein n=1 Tax=Dendrobium thyrsiflorum TaxID=117978 RepID=A0ABD0VNW1_DENTH